MKTKLHRAIHILMAMGLLFMSVLPLTSAAAEEVAYSHHQQAAARANQPTKPIVFEVVFSEPVRYFGDAGDIDFTGSTRPADLTYTVEPPYSGSTYEDTYTVSVSGMAGTGSVMVAIPEDIARNEAGDGNQASTSTDNIVAYDFRVPRITSVTYDGDDPTNQMPILFEVVFNEAVVGFEDPTDIDLSDSTAPGAAATISSDGPEGTDYTVSVSGMTASGEIVFGIPEGAAEDLAGNPSREWRSTDSPTVHYDIDPPEITLSSLKNPTKVNPVVEIVFNEDLSEELILGDINVTGPYSGLNLTKSIEKEDYELKITPNNDGIFSVSVPADVVEDPAGNGNLASEVFEIEYDSTPPTVIISSSAAANEGTTATSPIPFTITFDEPVYGFVPGSVTVLKNGAVTSFTRWAEVYEIEVTPENEGEVEVQVPKSGSIEDFAGNKLENDSNVYAVTYDPDALTVSLAPAAGQGNPTNNATIDFTATFSAAIDTETFEAEDITLGGTAGATTLAISEVGTGGTTFNIAVSGMTTVGTVTVAIPADVVESADGEKLNLASGTASVSYDNVRPAVTIENEETINTSVLNPFPLTITFSEPVTGFEVGEIAVSNCKASNLVAVTDAEYNVTITPSGSGNVSVSVPEGVAQDSAGNTNTASNIFTIEFNLGNPSVISIERLDVNPSKDPQVRFLVTFSEPVFEVDVSDFALTISENLKDASVMSVSGSGLTRIVTVSTGLGTGILRLDVAAGAVIINEDSSLIVDLPFVDGQVYQIRIQSFGDVPITHWAWNWIERLYNAGVTTGCSTVPLRYCPELNVTRAEMAKFLLSAIHGEGYEPPAVGLSTGFVDVPNTHWAADWIKQLAFEGITTGCAPDRYCPEQSVTRAEMAAFLLRAKHGSDLILPAATGIFRDVPRNYWAIQEIEQLYREGITTGCTQVPLNYCPLLPVTRAEMAAFLVRTFELP